MNPRSSSSSAASCASQGLVRPPFPDGRDQQAIPGVSSPSSSSSPPFSAEKRFILAQDEGAASGTASSLESSARSRKDDESMESQMQRRRRRRRWRRRRRRSIRKKNAMDTTPSVSSSIRILRPKQTLGKKRACGGPLSTPVPPWKFFSYGGSSEALLLDREKDPMITQKKKKKKKKQKEEENYSVHIPRDTKRPCESCLPAMAHVSARRLASALWQVQPIPFFEQGEVQKLSRMIKDFHRQQNPLEHHKLQALQQMIHPKMDAVKENTRENNSKSSNEMLEMLHHVWGLEKQHKSSLLSMSGLRRELDECRKQLRKLLQSEKVHQMDMENLGRKLMEERSLWMDQQDENIQHALVSIRKELEYERKAKIRLEHLHQKMERDFHDVKKALRKALYDLARERQARESVEHMCNELAREVDELKVREVELRRESAKVREEVEEERRMLQMAEAWREERVQMKLKEAKLEIEEKNEVLDKLRSKLDIFPKANEPGTVKDEVSDTGLNNREDVCNQQPKDAVVYCHCPVLQHNCVLNPPLDQLMDDDNATDSSGDEADQHSFQTSIDREDQQSNNRSCNHKVEGSWKSWSSNGKFLNEERMKQWPNSKLKGLDRSRSRKSLQDRGWVDFHNGTGVSDAREPQVFTSSNPRERRNGEQRKEITQLQSFGVNPAWLRETVENSRGLPATTLLGQMQHETLYDKSSPACNWKDIWPSLQPASPDEQRPEGDLKQA